MTSQRSVPTRRDDAWRRSIEARVDDHDVVLVELRDHLAALSKNFDDVVGWFKDKRTKVVVSLAFLALIGPQGAEAFKSLFGL